MSLHQFRLFSKLKNTHFLINYYGDAQNEYNVFNPPPQKKPNVSMRQFNFCEKGVWNTSLHIVWCSKLSHYLGQYSSRLLIFHDQGFTGSKFHSSSLERLCFEQELARNTIAPRIPELLWGKLRLITIICSGFLGSWGQTLCSHNVRFR